MAAEVAAGVGNRSFLAPRLPQVSGGPVLPGNPSPRLAPGRQLRPPLGAEGNGIVIDSRECPARFGASAVLLPPLLSCH